MKNAQDEVMLAVIDELRTLARERIPPAQATPRMRELTRRHDRARVELLFEPDAYGDTCHYDAVIDDADGAVTIRYCPDRGLPFLLRGAERLSDRDLVRVGDQVLKIRDAMALLDFVWSERPLMKRLVDVCLIEAELARHPVELSDEQVQDALDRLRADNGLESAAATLRWMAERGMTHEALERYACDQAAILALRERTVGAQVDAHFAAQGGDHTAATLAHWRIPDDETGRAFVEDIAHRRLALTEATAAWLARAASGPTPTIERVLRRELSGPVARAVFEAAPGHLRIVRDPGVITLVHVFAVHPAQLDEATRERIADELFAAWLDQQRGAASIEWNWGHAGRTRVD